MSRTETTAMLSELVEKRLKNRVSFWASEVNFDLGTSKNRRIDFFSCYEVKSCMADFKSGHGLTFYGDVNYLVTTRELAEELRVNYLLPRNINQVLTPSKKGDKLVPLFDVSGKCPSYRCRAASEMLYAMIEANGKRTN